MKRVLITRPDHDDATYYISEWSKPIIQEAKKRNIKVLDLRREKANRTTFLSFLEEHNPRFVILNGHGDQDSIFGYRDEPIISKGKDEVLLRNRIVYSIACEAARSLGKSVVEKGCECFIGYENKFVFLVDERRMNNPLKDKIAKSFFTSTNKIPISIIKANKTKSSIERAKKEFRRQLIKWRLSHEIEAPYVVQALLWDLISLKLIGRDDSVF